jgi:hypothetical protein
VVVQPDPVHPQSGAPLHVTVQFPVQLVILQLCAPWQVS